MDALPEGRRMAHYHTSVLAGIACASCALVNCPNCDGTGKVPAAWDAPEADCPDCEASGLVTRLERDQLAATADTWQHRSRP